MRFLMVLTLAVTVAACGRHSPAAPTPDAEPTVLDVTVLTVSSQPIVNELVRAVSGSVQASCRSGDQGTCQIVLPERYRGSVTLLVSPMWFESAERIVLITEDRTRTELRLAPASPGPLSGEYLLTVEASATCGEWPPEFRKVSVDVVLWQRGDAWWTEVPNSPSACGFYGSVRGTDVDVHYIKGCTQDTDAVVIADLGASRVLTMNGVGQGVITSWGIDAQMNGVLAVEEAQSVPPKTAHACTAHDHRVVLTRASGR